MDMFCFQCEQTAHNSGCTSGGVCSKSAKCANLQDDLISSVINFSQNCERNKENIKLITKALFMTVTNVNFCDEDILNFTQEIKNLSKTDTNYDLKELWRKDEDTRSLKSLILFGLKGMAAYYYHAIVLGYYDQKVSDFIFNTLKQFPQEFKTDELISEVLKVGEINLKCMELLDKANTETYKDPIPTKVSCTIEKGPFIIVSGHDLHDLEKLLKQSEGSGVNIYTHGEMLPCHSYPELKKYSHLKGNFGTAWQNQQKEFDNVPAAILFTTNCIMKVQNSYKDRVFTTSVVNYPNTIHIKDDDFTPVIETAKKLGGYKEDRKMTGINGGNELLCGFGRKTLFDNANKLVTLMKEGKIKRIFLLGGCDGAKVGRNYYTEFAKLTPKDTLILTLACGKYRFNDLDLGEIEGIPRIIDVGQCNDAYSAIRIAQELAHVYGCNVNEVPLSFVLSWYEQKAVCILLTLLYLKIENIRLGPSLPAFLSKNVLNFLVEKFKIKQITTPQKDLQDCLFGR